MEFCSLRDVVLFASAFAFSAAASLAAPNTSGWGFLSLLFSITS